MNGGIRPLVAEFVATFAFIFVGAGAICANEFANGDVGLLGIALAHAVALAVMVSATGPISGGHVNPAVTIALWAGGKIGLPRAALYIVAQLAGAAVGALFLRWIFPADVWQAVHLGATEVATNISTGTAIFLEAVLTFFLVFAVYGTAVDERAPKSLAGFGIGLVLLFDILVGGPLTGASMNPARTFGPALVGCFWANHVVYWVGPIAGGLLATVVYKFIASRPVSVA